MENKCINEFHKNMEYQENNVDINFIKIKGRSFYRRISFLAYKDVEEELKVLKKFKIQHKGLRYKVISKPMSDSNPIVAHNIYVNKLELCCLNN